MNRRRAVRGVSLLTAVVWCLCVFEEGSCEKKSGEVGDATGKVMVDLMASVLWVW